MINGTLDESTETFSRLGFGFVIAAVFSVAGYLFGESTKNNGKRTFMTATIAFFLTYIVPVLTIALLQVKATDWLVSFMLAPISLLWLSLSAFVYTQKTTEKPITDSTANQDIQNRFWWLNHRAIASAIIAGFGFLLITAGIFVIEQSLSALFGLQTDELFYEYLLPFTALFLTPLYWLATIPELDDFHEMEISKPDFLSRAIGFMGQYVMVPFLFLYSLILFAYGLQIILIGELPKGMLGWMVLAFTTAGAVTWLILHPSFMHTNTLVRYFRRFWFWLTILPIILYFMAVIIRINAYGLTEDRIWLLAGGIWATLLTVAFLTRKFADIRLVPGLALLLFILISVGPWNFINAPKIHQAIRLETALNDASRTDENGLRFYEWNDESVKVARGAYLYLIGTDYDRQMLSAIIERQGIDFETADIGHNHIFTLLGLNEVKEQEQGKIITREFSRQKQNNSTNLSRTPYFIGNVELFITGAKNIADLTLELDDISIRVESGDAKTQFLDINEWVTRQQAPYISDPAIGFDINGRKFVLLVQKLNIRENTITGKIENLTRVEALLFTDSALPASDQN